jgi:hypothetical protein
MPSGSSDIQSFNPSSSHENSTSLKSSPKKQIKPQILLACLRITHNIKLESL